MPKDVFSNYRQDSSVTRSRSARSGDSPKSQFIYAVSEMDEVRQKKAEWETEVVQQLSRYVSAASSSGATNKKEMVENLQELLKRAGVTTEEANRILLMTLATFICNR